MLRGNKPGQGTRRLRPPAMEEILPVRRYDWIAHFGRRTPDKVAAVDLASERRFTYAQFDARISRLAAHLRSQLEVAARGGARRPRRGAKLITRQP